MSLKRIVSFILTLTLLLTGLPIQAKAEIMEPLLELELLGVQSEAIMVQVTQPTEELLGEHDSFKYQYRVKGLQEWNTYANTRDLSCEIRGLDSNTEYEIRAIWNTANTAGESSVMCTSDILYAATQSVGNITLNVDCHNTCVFITATCDEASTVTGTVYVELVDNEGTKVSGKTVDVTDYTSYVWFTGLKPHSEYTVSAWGYSSYQINESYKDWGDVYFEKTISTNGSDFIPYKPSHFKVTRDENNSNMVWFHWDNILMMHPASRVEIEESRDGVNWSTLMTVPHNIPASHEVEDSEDRYYRARTLCEEQRSDWTELQSSENPVTPSLTAHTELKVYNITPTTATLSWNVTSTVPCKTRLTLLSEDSDDATVYDDIEGNSYILEELNPNTTYWATVTPTAEGVEGEESVRITFRTDEGIEEPSELPTPSAPIIQSIGCDYVDVYWDYDIESDVFYDITLKNLTTEDEATVKDVDTDSYQFTELTLGDTYSVSIVAKTDRLTSEQSKATAFTLVPDSDIRLTVCDVVDDQVSIEWDAADNIKYEVYYSLVDKPNDMHHTETTTGMVALKPLEPGKLYSASLTDGKEELLKFRFITQGDFTPPIEEEKKLSVSDITHNSAVLSWDFVFGDVNGINTVILYPEDDIGTELEFKGGKNSVTVTGLSPNTTYSVKLVNQFDEKIKELFYDYLFTTEDEPVEVLDFIKDFTITGLTHNSVALSWSSKEDVQTYAIAVYDENNDAVYNEVVNKGRVFVTSLSPSTTYSVEIGWINDTSSGTQKFENAFTTYSDTGESTYDYSKITGLKQLDCDTESVMITWDKNTEGANQYEIGFKEKGETDYVYSYSAGEFKMFSGLSMGATYVCRVRPVNSDKIGPWADIELVTKPDGQVYGLALMESTTDSIKIKWNKMDGANAYYIQYGNTGSVSNNSTTVYSDNYYTITGLSKDSVYDVTVFPMRVSEDRSVSSGYDYGAGAFSKFETLPDKNLGASKLKYKSNKSITFTCDTAQTATKYSYEIWDSKKRVLSGSSKWNVITISNSKLKRNVVYKLRVRSVNKGGPGEWSKWKEFAHQSTIKKIVKSGSNAARVTWNKTVGAKRYVLYGSTKKTGKYVKLKETNKTSYVVKKIGKKSLKKKHTYYFYVESKKKVNGKWVTVDTKPSSKRWSFKFK